MKDIKEKNNDFIGYEYHNITISKDMMSLFSDGYQNFGWKLENTESLTTSSSVSLQFKRDRKIRNKAELTRLQRQFNACSKEIEIYEKEKTLGASVIAYSLGLSGCAFLAGAVFAYNSGLLPLCIALAIPGFLGWILPYFCFNLIRKRKTEKVLPLIQQKYDEIYHVCEKASQLL